MENIELKSRLLQRQIRKHLKKFSDEEKIRAGDFLRAIDQEYINVKEDRVFLERKLDVSTKELSEKNERLKDIVLNNIKVLQKVEESKKYLSLLIDNLWEGLIVVDNNRLITEVNARAEQMMGIKKEVLIWKKYNAIIQFVSDNDSVIIGDFIEKTLLKDEEYSFNRNVNLVGWKRDIPVFVTSSPIKKNIGNKDVSCIVVFRDATKDRELTNMKNEFLSVASHELRTPMTVIKGYIGLIINKKLGDINERQEGYLQKILDNTENLIEMVNDMLDLNKMEAWKMNFSYENVDVKAVIEKNIKDMEELFKKKRLSITTELEEICGISDKAKIRQLLINFLSNAYKFTSDEGIIEVKLEKLEGQNFFKISVSDSWVGIEKEDLWKLFKKFSQVWSHLNKTEKGTGLWLSICKRITEWMWWNIWVESEYGDGTTFFAVLPLRLCEKK